MGFLDPAAGAGPPRAPQAWTSCSEARGPGRNPPRLCSAGSWLSCQREDLIFPIFSGSSAFICPKASSLPFLGTLERATPAGPLVTRVDVEAA